MYSELIFPIVAKHEMVKYSILQMGFFCHLKWDFFLSFELSLVMFITFFKEKEQTLLEGIQMVKTKQKSI